MAESYREKESGALRVLFCFGVTQSFFDESPDRIPAIVTALTEAFDDLAGRFGITVLGTMDDDELTVGSSSTWPWTCYILADAPDLDAVTNVTNILRTGEVDGARLWKYLRVEARVGRPLFFGTK